MNLKFLYLCINNKPGEMKKSDTTTLHLPILIEQDEDNYFIVSCPVFKGCHSYGVTIEEALSNIREVIDMCIEEEKGTHINRFVGFREMQISIKNTAP
jgi:predicted RNase H-like HicB family nuclease